MAGFVKGDVVVVPFPFSDLSSAKKRPALLLADVNGEDFILLQITSQAMRDSYAVSLDEDDFVSGSLKKKSNIRPNKIFTADKSLVLYKLGAIKREKTKEVIEKVIEVIN